MQALIAPCIGPGNIMIGFDFNIAILVTLPLSSLIPSARIPGFPIESIESAIRSLCPTEDPPIVTRISF